MQINIDLMKKFNLIDQVAVVTGGAGFLGRQFCKTLAQAGAKVICADVKLDSAKEWLKELDSQDLKITSFQMDVTKPKENQALSLFVEREFKKLDILVTCAAVDPKFDNSYTPQFDYSFEKYPLEFWQTTLNVNLTGAFLSAQAAIPLMLKNSYGVVIMISSMYGLVAPDQRIYQVQGELFLKKPADYPVSKAGIIALVKYLAAYYAGLPVRFNALSPGGVYNNQSEKFVKNYSFRSPLGRMANAEEMNAALLFLASPASSYMNGANLVMDGGWSTW